MNVLANTQWVMEQGEAGRKRGQQQRLNHFAQQAYGADPTQRDAIVQQAIGTDADAGFALDKSLQADEERRTRTLVNMSKMLTGTPEQYREPLYQRMKPSLQRMGLTTVPDTYTPEVGQIAEQLVQAYGATVDGVPASFRALDMQARAAGYQPGTPDYQKFMRAGVTEAKPSSAAIQYKVVRGEDGVDRLVALDPREMAAQPLQPGGYASQSAVPSGPSVQQHADVVAAAANRMIAAGIPEDQVNAWVAETTGGVDDGAPAAALAAPAPVGPNPFASPTLEEQEAMKARGKARIELQYGPQTAGATEAAKEQARIAAIGPTAAAEADAALRYGTEKTRESASEAAAKIPQIQDVKRGIVNMKSALDNLKGRFVDTGPVDQWAMRWTEDGQKLEAAAGAMRNSLLALTRVPGVGSQSDLEARIDALRYPSLGNHPSVNAQIIASLEAFIKDIESQITRRAAGATGGRGPAQRVTDRASFDALPSGAIYIGADGRKYRKP